MEGRSDSGIIDNLVSLSFVVGAALYLVGCLAVFLASTHQMPVAPLYPVTTIKTISSLPCVPWGTTEDHCASGWTGLPWR